MSYYCKTNIPKTHRMDGEEDEEENIYANPDSFVRTEANNTGRHRTPQHTGIDCVRMRSSRAAPVCLVLLCFLLLIAVIVLSVFIYTNNTNSTQERNQLLTRNMQLAKDKDELSSKCHDLTEQRDQLNQEKDKLSKMDGWVFYKSSFYFISSEKRSWADSRRDCTERGADLTIIDNKEEQKIVSMVCGGGDGVWIGLTDSDEEDKWKWTDGSALTYTFWSSGEPTGGKEENCVKTLSSGWIDHRCKSACRWTCEKKM